MGDGWVLAEVAFKGTQDGPFFGAPATGKSLNVRGAWVGRFDSEGLMTDLYVYWDALTQLMQLGLFPPPADINANKAIVQRYFDDVWNKGKSELIPEFVSADILDHLPEGESKGIEGLKQHVVTTLTAFPDIHTENSGNLINPIIIRLGTLRANENAPQMSFP
jgi:predicted ester cyclase